MLVRKEERIGALGTLGAVGVLMAVSLSPYFILISQRVHSTDQALALELTRRPDLFRLTEVLGFVALLGLVYVVRNKNHGVTNETLVFTAALALTSFVVFNQQVIHGRSLQPFHYGLFVVNYVAIAALFITLVLVCRTLSSRGQKIWRVAIYVLTFLALLSGAYQALLAGRRYAAANFRRDSALPAMRQLAIMGRNAQGQSLDTNSLVLCTDVTVADTLPTVAPQPIMWAPHMYQFSGTSAEEDREKFSLYLYLTSVSLDSVDRTDFEQLDPLRRFYISFLIGRGRSLRVLRSTWTPITASEIKSAMDRYHEFTATVDRALIARHPIT
ncbi:MAG: hypothetical protein ABR568_06810 [Pyrinomonadaceae bacterium]